MARRLGSCVARRFMGRSLPARRCRRRTGPAGGTKGSGTDFTRLTGRQARGDPTRVRQERSPAARPVLNRPEAALADRGAGDDAGAAIRARLDRRRAPAPHAEHEAQPSQADGAQFAAPDEFGAIAFGDDRRRLGLRRDAARRAGRNGKEQRLLGNLDGLLCRGRTPRGVRGGRRRSRCVLVGTAGHGHVVAQRQTFLRTGIGGPEGLPRSSRPASSAGNDGTS